MLQILLTTMLFILPFLVSQKKISYPGLHIGLWISLFFWGRLHAMFSILIFGVGIVYYIFTTVQDGSVKKASVKTKTTHALWIPRSGTRPLTGLLAILMIFCAFGNACQDYGTALALPSAIQEAALSLGFAGALAGPIAFGGLSDKSGPFAAFMLLLCIGLTAILFTALSYSLPYCFPIGILMTEAVISGVFTLIPLILLHFYSRFQLSFVLPVLFLFLAGLWAAALKFYNGAGALPQDYLLSMVFLLVMSPPMALQAWKGRLAVL